MSVYTQRSVSVEGRGVAVPGRGISPMDRGRSRTPFRSQPSPVLSMASERGRTTNRPMKAQHYAMGSSSFSFSSREPSPHLAMDRITRNMSPGRTLETDDDISPRIPQPYRTSFSAVTSPCRVKKAESVRVTPTTQRPNFITGNPLGLSRGFPHKSQGTTSNNNNNKPQSTSMRSRTNSRDMLTHSNRSSDELSDTGQISVDRAGSFDALDGREDGCDRLPARGVSGFENRRLNPKYSSTPTRLPTSPLVAANSNGSSGRQNSNSLYSRLESNLSADTLDSVFMPTTPHSPLMVDTSLGPNYYPGGGTGNQSHDMDRPPDSGYVEGRVEKGECIAMEYVHIIDITHQELEKERKKKRLPEPNEETGSLVRDMMYNLEKRLAARSASAPGTPLHRVNGVKSDKTSLGKKSLSASITNFFRKITMSPKTHKKNTGAQNGSVSAAGKKKPSKRSKSAGRLEGNRSLRGSKSSVGGSYNSRDVSIEPTSTESSDQSGAVLHNGGAGLIIANEHVASPLATGVLNTSSKKTARSTSHMVDKENSVNSGSRSQHSHDTSGSKPPLPSNSARVYLKSIEDNQVINRGDDRQVYRTFKEKQSPGYRRQAETAAFRNHALKVVEIEDTLDESSSPNVAEQTQHSSEPSLTPQNNLQPQHNHSKVNLKDRDEVINNQVGRVQATPPHRDTPPHRVTPPQQNGQAEVHSNGKAPSYAKIGSAISSYNSRYGKQTPPTNSPSNYNNVNNTHATNNNILNNQQNGGYYDEAPAYSPDGASFVKTLSQKYEALSGDELENDGYEARKKKVLRTKSNSVSPMKSSNIQKNVNSPVNNSSSEALSKSINNRSVNSTALSNTLSSSINTTLDNYNSMDTSDISVDSQNIDFKEARKAFSSVNTRSVEQPTSPSHEVRTIPSDLPTGAIVNSNVDVTDNSAVTDTHYRSDILVTDTHYRSDILLNSIDSNHGDKISECNDIMNSPEREHHIIQNGFLEEDIQHISTPSQVKVHALAQEGNMAEYEPRMEGNKAVSKSNGSLDSFSVSSDLTGTAKSCQSSTEGLHSSSSSSSLKGGQYYLQVVEAEEVLMQALCSRAEDHLQTNTLTDEVSGKIRAAIGKGYLLTTKKFKQFKGLCHQNLSQGSEESFQTTAQDLAGFWDMVMLQVDEVSQLFGEIDKLKSNNWKMSPKQSPQLRKCHSASSTPKSTPAKRAAASAPISAKAQEAARARTEARRRLIEAKKAGRQQRKTSETDESVEIYVA